MSDPLYRVLTEKRHASDPPLRCVDFERRLLSHYKWLHNDGECAGILCPYCAWDEYQKEKRNE